MWIFYTHLIPLIILFFRLDINKWKKLEWRWAIGTCYVAIQKPLDQLVNMEIIKEVMDTCKISIFGFFWLWEDNMNQPHHLPHTLMGSLLELLLHLTLQASLWGSPKIKKLKKLKKSLTKIHYGVSHFQNNPILLFFFLLKIK